MTLGSTTDGRATRPARPELTVVVSALGRREFVASAVGSVLRQDLESVPWEIMLVHDLDPPPAAEDPLGRIRTLRVPPGRVGAALVAAAEVARGRVLALLDDDDLWEPSKLTRVARAFAEHPRLAYLRNRLEVFDDPPGDPAGPSRHRSLAPVDHRPPRDAVELVPATELSPRRTAELFWDGWAYNQSSIAVRRDLVLGVKGALAQIRTGYSGLLFYASVMAGSDLAFDPRTLTRFRLHAGNASGVSSSGGDGAARWVRMFTTASERIDDAEVIARLIEEGPGGRALASPVRTVQARYRLLEDLRHPETPRDEVLGHLRCYVRGLPWRERLTQRHFVALGAARVLHPALPRRVLGPRRLPRDPAGR